jgi:ATP-binding cassette subfamily F protein 3
VLISHDPHLIELTVDRFWLVKDGLCRQFDGDLADYRDLVLAEDRAGADRGSRYRGGDGEDRKPARREPEIVNPLAAIRRIASPTVASRRNASNRAAMPCLRSQPANSSASSSNRRWPVDKLSQALALIEKKLADPALYNGHPDTIAEWQRKHADVAKRLSDAEDAWLKAQASLIKRARRTSCSLPRFGRAWQVLRSAWGRADAAVVRRY